VALGPHLGFGFIKSSESIHTLSEIGLVLLMFILGLEIDVKKLLQAGKAVAINGVTQFAGCALLATVFFSVLGFAKFGEGYELVYLAVACSLSSTLIVVKVLSDRMELDTLTSRITLGILVLQDLWAIAFLAIQPNLADLRASVLLVSLGRGALLIGASWALAKYVLPRVLEKVAKNPELMLLTAIGWCATVCGIAGALHLSLEMGGLIAGVAIASFPYHVEIASKVMSLRDFFITLFFVALGLQIPQPSTQVLVLAAAIVGFVLISRVLTMFPVLYALRYGNRGSLIPALNLSQVSEFSLVLVSLGVTYKHLPQDVLSSFVLALVVTALLSSLMIPHAHAVYQAVNPWLVRLGFKDTVVHDESTSGAGHNASAQIVLLGFYREASSLLQELRIRHSIEGLREQVHVVDFNPEAHQELKSLGIACSYGDISHLDTLRHLDLAHAKVLICTINDHQLKGTSNLKLLRALKSLAPSAKIIVTAETLDSAKEMYDEGAAYVLLPRLLVGRHIADLIEHIEVGADLVMQKEARENLSKWKEVVP
jgi:Kef-type K+ transport system membrane component KefB